MLTVLELSRITGNYILSVKIMARDNKTSLTFLVLVIFYIRVFCPLHTLD